MFKTESDLVIDFKKNFAKSFLKQIEPKGKRRFALLEEFDSLNGIADIVFAIYRPYLKVTKVRKLINYNWLTALKQLESKNVISLEDYMALSGVTIRTARKQLECFIEAEFLESMGNNLFEIKKPYKPILQTIISIEAKLNNWKRALLQACRYKRFSNTSFVLLPDMNVKKALENLDQFKKYEIGLITIGTNGLKIHYSPPRKNRPTNDAILKANEIAYAQLTSTQ